MRIVYHTCPAFLEPALHLVRELSRVVEVHLLLQITPQSWRNALFDIQPKEIPAGIIPAGPILAGCFPSGVEAYWRDLASFNLVVHKSAKSFHPSTWSIASQTAEWIRRLRPDLVHFDDVSIRSVPAIMKVGRIPLVLSLHDPEPHIGEANWRIRLGRHLTFGHVNRFVLHNHFSKAPLCRTYGVCPERVEVVPLGVYGIYRECSSHREHSDQKLILFFGRLSPYKGLEVLYLAAPLVCEEIANTKFIIAGAPVSNYRPPPIPQLPNGGSVEAIERYIPNHELAALFSKAAIVVCPYIDATQSGVVLTAYGFGKPVIASSVGGLPEYVEEGKTGYLVPPRDSVALARAIIEILTSDETRTLMTSTIRSKAETVLSWRRIADQMLDVYEGAVRGGNNDEQSCGANFG